MMRSFLLVGVMVCVLGACSRGEPDLITLQSDGPDEFSIVPTKPLEQPESLTTLPPPQPGGRNRVDPVPEAEAIAALGGNQAALSRRSGDGAVVSYASRYGTSPAIRTELATADLEFRSRNRGRVLERLFSQSTYFRAYRRLSLDQHAELERFRRAGVRTPAAPPAGIEE